MSTAIIRTDPYAYLDGGKLPTDALDLFFLLKRALKHNLILANDVLKSAEDARDYSYLLAKNARRVAAIAEALAVATGPTSHQQDNALANKKDL